MPRKNVQSLHGQRNECHRSETAGKAFTFRASLSEGSKFHAFADTLWLEHYHSVWVDSHAEKTSLGCDKQGVGVRSRHECAAQR